MTDKELGHMVQRPEAQYQQNQGSFCPQLWNMDSFHTSDGLYNNVKNNHVNHFEQADTW